MHLKDQTILGFSSLNKRTRKNERNISWFSEFLSAWNLKIKILIEIYSTHVFYVVISLVVFDKDEEVPPSHTPLWTQTPPAFQVNHFSLVLVGWTQMETVKYYRAMLTFHLSCNRSLHARYNHHLLLPVFLSLSLSLCWCTYLLHESKHSLTSAISSQTSLSILLLWTDNCCMLNFHHRNTYPIKTVRNGILDYCIFHSIVSLQKVPKGLAMQ